ncbi:hypothetical protein [Nannocystis radixulma]|uniref:Uncharacterized protein n=1 Tax=Nannocystis radixulma TaxID=2995305 RepID=A0ABT5BG50_9BACT|nr:hypothetical protein [Nannocystis radixulma]MDC0673126.1 hypothetical protein [Nannocystis radixulma]
MDPLVLDLGTHVGPSLVRRYLDVHPQVTAALARAGARLVTFEPELAAQEFFAAIQDALAAAARSVPADILPLFVAVVVLPDLLAACGRGFDGERLPVPALACPRGGFLGYVALGEGGVAFFGADGQHGQPAPEAVLGILERAR